MPTTTTGRPDWEALPPATRAQGGEAPSDSRSRGEHGAQNIRRTARSRAEGEPESDSDLLVEMDSNRSLLDLVGLGQDLEELLTYTVDVLTDASLHPALRERILALARAP